MLIITVAAMDNVDWILIIILVVVCAIFLVWFGSWLCRGSAPEQRVQGQGERSQGVAKAALKVFDYLRPRAKTIGAVETIGGASDITLEWLDDVTAKSDPSERYAAFVKVFGEKTAANQEAYDSKIKMFLTVLANNWAQIRKKERMDEADPKSIQNKIKNAISTAKNASAGSTLSLLTKSTHHIDALRGFAPGTLMGTESAPIEDFVDSSETPEQIELKDAIEKADDLAKQVLEHTAKVSELELKVKTLTTERDSASREKDSTQQHLGEIIKERNVAQNTLTETEKNLKALEGAKTIADADVQRLTGELAVLQTKLDSATQDAGVVQGEIARLKTQVADIESQKVSIESASVTALAAAKTAAATASEETKKQHDLQITDIKEQHKKQVNELDDQLEKLSEQLGKKSAEVLQQNARVEELTDSLKDLQNQLVEASKKAQADLTTKNDLTKKLYDAQQQIASGEEQYAAKIKELADVTGRVRTLEEGLGKIKEERDATHAVLQELLEAVKGVVETIDSLRANVAKDIADIRGRLDHIDVEKTVDPAKLASVQASLSNATDPKDFGKRLADSMAAEPFHTMITMTTTDANALQTSYDKFSASLAAISKLKGAVAQIPPDPRKGILSFLLDAISTTAESVTGSIASLEQEIKNDQLGIEELKTNMDALKGRLDAMDIKIASMDLEIKDLQAAAKTVASTDSIKALQKEVDALKQEVADADSGDTYEEVYITNAKPPNYSFKNL
jgi:chromosome segregation ATPase